MIHAMVFTNALERLSHLGETAPTAQLDEREEHATSFEPTKDEAEHSPEVSVLDDLAELTVDHSPWDAAVALFNPITKEAADVA